MPILLVRHAEAGERSKWDGDDRERPLSRRGRAQARRMVALLEPYGPKRLISSPYVRCTETLGPLAAAVGLTVEEHPELAEGAGNAAVSLARSVGGETAVLCTHGDIVPEVLDTLVTVDGMSLRSEREWAKGSTWVLEGTDGRFVEARYLPPPGDPPRGP